VLNPLDKSDDIIYIMRVPRDKENNRIQEQATMKANEIIASEFVEKIEKSGKLPWFKPWYGIEPVNIRGTGYRGINLLILGFEMITQEYKSPYWLTFNQCRGLGGKIKKGSKGVKIVFWKWVNSSPDFDPDLSPQNPQDIDNSQGKQYPILRYYNVFNIDQTEGIPEDKLPEIPEIKGESWNPIEETEKFIGSIPGLEIRYSVADIACYKPSEDYIQIPSPETFQGPEHYYSVHFHEIGHWTGHPDRLNRDLKSLRESKHDYSFEELIAELTAAFLCNKFGILNRTFNNSAAYIQSWVKVLKSDPKMIFKAASKAQKAFDYIVDIADYETPQETPEGVEIAA
jgi:antirestriction protein ArdC